MVYHIQHLSKQDQHAVIQSLGTKGCQPAKIISGCGQCMAMLVSKTMVKDWCRQLHDNARRQVANAIKIKVQHMKWAVPEHLAYSPDL
jgi:hypothetical protein